MNKRFEALDAFRGICALSVAIFHMHFIGSITELEFFRGSSIFVEFFFVLSGFVLAHGYAYKDSLKFFTLMKSRFFRLYPLHLFMFCVMLILEVVRLFANKYNLYSSISSPFTENTAIVEIIPNLLLLQSWTPYTEPLSFNYPSWSISVEFYMYALFFCSIITCKKNKVTAWLFLSLSAFMLIYLQPSFLTLEALRGLSCFFGGTFTYYLFKRAQSLKLNHIVGTSIEVLLLSMIVVLVQSKLDNRSLVVSVLFMVTVFVFAFEFGLISKILKIKPFQAIGKLSYSIYMTHAAILIGMGYIITAIQKISGVTLKVTKEDVTFFDFGTPVINNIVIFIIALIIIGISIVTYHYIELAGQNLNSRGKKLTHTDKYNTKQKVQISET